MAEVVSDFNFCNKRSIRYPWDLWGDGQVWKVYQGVDFHCSLQAMRRAVWIAANKRGLGSRTSMNKEDNSVTLQFFAHTK